MSAIVGENGVLNQATGSSLKTKLAGYLEELEMSVFGNSEVVEGQGYVEEKINCFGNDVKKYIPSMEEAYINEFVILNNKLMYVGTNEELKKASNELGIESGSNGQEIVSVSNIVKEIADKNIAQPKDDEETPTEFKGLRLYTKNTENSEENNEKWKVVTDHTATNALIGRYGSGWYLIKKNDTLSNGEQALNDYVVNYSTGEMKILSNYKVWDVRSQLGVDNTDGKLALHVDPTNLADGSWTGVTKHGDVVYNSTSRALVFNENTTNVTDEDGYLEYNKTGLKFRDGFTFEMYMNLSRLRYNNMVDLNTVCSSLFCKMPTLNSDFALSMRFGFLEGGAICKFYSSSSWTGKKQSLITTSPGSVNLLDGSTPGFTTNEDAYITYVYRRYEKTDESVRTAMGWTEDADRLEYYINGNLYGYTYYGKDSYASGCDAWDVDTSPLFVGVAPWGSNGCLYYLKGKVYACRLYEKSLTETEVKTNYDTTVQFRNSGL